MPSFLIFWLSACIVLSQTVPSSAAFLQASGQGARTLPQQPGNAGHRKIPSRRKVLAGNDETNGQDASDPSPLQQSRISFIRSYNLASVVNAENPTGTISLSMDKGTATNVPTLVAVTGETGTGKSLLVARVVELLTGGKAAASLVTDTTTTTTTTTTTEEDGDDGGENEIGPEAPSAFVEMELRLRGPHLAAATEVLERIGIDSQEFFSGGGDDADAAVLTLRRTLTMQPQSSSGKNRLKSVCEINGRPVTLKAMANLASPLFAVVDASTAASALAKADSRMAVIDTAVSASTLASVSNTQTKYRQCRRERESLEDELASRTLPQGFSMSAVDRGEKDVELLNHWIDELDVFEGRVAQFRDLLASNDDVMSGSTAGVGAIVRDVIATKWMDNSAAKGQAFTSTLYMKFNDFRDALRRLDDQLVAARNTYEALASLSAAESAMTAVERARNFLFDAAGTQNDDSSDTRMFEAAEHSHELLNAAEAALLECARFLEDDERGLLRTLEAERSACPMSVEEVDAILLDWNSLARKHVIMPDSLPSCHKALQSERDGNVEARTLLPKAIAEEELALQKFVEACSVLTTERCAIADTLSRTVTGRMPSLGMEQSVFRVELQSALACTDKGVYGTGSTLGVDTVDFLLLHGKAADRRGGSIYSVASSGEKARILLAIECALPGSVGASCGGGATTTSNGSTHGDANLSPVAPIAVLYDEIDAHVGGRAAVSLANMLVDQSRSCQVVAITHSPSVAAAASLHIVIQRAASQGEGSNSRGSQNWIRAGTVAGPERLTELARMASGDLAIEEAQIFAQALIRDGAKRRESAAAQ